jgi:hypothetical protein
MGSVWLTSKTGTAAKLTPCSICSVLASSTVVSRCQGRGGEHPDAGLAFADTAAGIDPGFEAADGCGVGQLQVDQELGAETEPVSYAVACRLPYSQAMLMMP